MTRIIDDPALLNELIHVHVFGGSVEPTSDYEISQAVETGRARAVHIDATHLVYAYIFGGHEYLIETIGDNFGCRLHERRHGKPYQADIEAHVAAYRGHIPDYVDSGDWFAKGIAKSTDSADVLFAKRGDRALVTIAVDGASGYNEYQAWHDDLSIAFWNAAIRACGYGEESHLNVPVRPANAD